MSDMRTALAAADENYLVALSNKGLYKRAQRELPEAGASVALEGERVEVRFGDGTNLTMEGSLQNYTCSCPSRTICKHLLMGVLAAQIELQAQGGEAAPAAESQQQAAFVPPPPDFSAVSDLSYKELEKLAGKKNAKTGALAVALGEKCNIEESSTLRITLGDTGNSVLFLPGAPLADCRCTCKTEGFCAHRAQAVAQYIKYKKGQLPQEFLPQEGESALEFSAYTIPYIRQFVTQVLDTGLARLPQDARGRFLQLGTLCHSQRLANMERLCNRIAGQLEYFTALSATFDRDRLIGDLAHLLFLCQAVEQGAGSKEIIGVFRETYRPVPQMELWALGAWGWQSTGGYVGVTTIFFCPGEGEYTYTAALPQDLGTDAQKLYQQAAPWGLQTKLAQLAGSRFSLRGGKVSGKGQLSASESGIAHALGSLELAAPALAPLRFDDFDALLEALWQRGEAGENGPMTAILLPARTDTPEYDKIAQEWRLPLLDKAERRLTARVRYQPATRLLLSNLEHFGKRGKLWQPLLARVSLQGGELTAFPVTLYGETPFNLGLDHPQDPKEKGAAPLFDWGDGT